MKSINLSKYGNVDFRGSRIRSWRSGVAIVYRWHPFLLVIEFPILKNKAGVAFGSPRSMKFDAHSYSVPTDELEDEYEEDDAEDEEEEEEEEFIPHFGPKGYYQEYGSND